MNLFELFAKIGLDTSEYESKMGGAASLAESVADRIGGALKTAAKVGTAALSAASAAVGALTKQAVDGFGEYEQLAGGIETLFGEASDTVKENAEKAFETAGMSANDYMQMVTSFAGALLKSTSNTTQKATEQDTKALSDALDKQYSLRQKAYSQQETALKRTLDRQYKMTQKSYDKQYESARKAYDKQYQAMSDAVESEIEKREKSYDKKEQALQRSQEREIAALERATDKRLALIDKEYEATIKAIDRQQAARMADIDEQIAAINGASEAEQRQREKQVTDDKKAELEKALAVAKTKSRREELQKELTQLIEDEAYKQREAQRRAQIEHLRDQKEAIKDEASAQKTAEKEKRDEAVDAVKKSSSEQLAALKEAHKKELEALKEKDKTALENFKKAKQNELAALRESQQERLEKMREGQQEELERLRQSQDDQLEATKEHHANLLKELKDSIAEQKKASKSGADEATKNTKVTAAQQKEAARLADMAIIDMSDNVNKLGTNMDMVQNAYKGFSRGNFVMLDNLQLGFAGSKEGMQELLNRAEQISGYKYDISSYGDIVNAIHVVQEEMGITGTTQKEAESTIQGSLARLKAAWSNMVTSFGRNDADLSKNINDTVEAAKTYFGNLMPVISRAIGGIGEFIKEVAPIIVQELPGLTQQILPPLIEAATALLTGLIQSLPTLITVLVEQIPFIASELFNAIVATGPQFIEAGKQIFQMLSNGIGDGQGILTTLGNLVNAIGKYIDEHGVDILEKGTRMFGRFAVGVMEALPDILDKVAAILSNMIDYFMKNMPRFMQIGMNLLLKLISGLSRFAPKVLGTIITLISNILISFANNFPKFVETGLKLLGQILMGIILAIPPLTKGIWDIIKNLIKQWTSVKWGDIGVNLLKGIAKGITSAVCNVSDAIAGVQRKVWDGIGSIVNKAWTWGSDLIGNFINGIYSKFQDLVNAAYDLAQTVANYLGFSEPKLGPLSNFHTYAPDMMELFAKGVKENEDKVRKQIESSFDFGNVGEISSTEGKSATGALGNLITFNIYQQPGEDMEALAYRIGQILNAEYERKRLTFA